ncbi:hypothetical protein GCM10009623_35190 [Nocardioides aestuarii]|uniref:Addiction module protein n=1 Tax=Nocardioides aestuarii TaxID=252231 RepID=A0ABW4TSX4_9ACTN
MVDQHDADLQAAVDSTSVARDSDPDGEIDLVQYLRDQLAEREIETSDEAWLQRQVENIKADPNYMVDGEPDDYTPIRDR